MKVMLIAFLILSAIVPVVAQTSGTSTTQTISLSDLTCDRFLLESYDIDGGENLSEDKNIVCPSVATNCCSYNAQMQIYKKFIVADEQGKMARFYKEFPGAYERIFQQFGEIEAIAETTIQRTADYPGSNCSKIAKTIQAMKISRLYAGFAPTISRAFDFLLKSREGFYCSLCDAQTHQHYDLTTSEVNVSYGMCAKMVEESLNYFLFKYNFFMKFSRLYADFLAKCDLKGHYRGSRKLKHEIKFYRKDAIVGELNFCFKGYNKAGAMKNCNKFCQRFNPVRYSEYLEGEIDKLYSYSKSLKKMMDHWKARFEREERMNREAAKNDRLLAEDKEVKKTERMDEEIDQLNQFNKQFRTAMVKPITYSFDEDLSIKYHVNFDESLFAPGVEWVYNLADFKPKVRSRGINYYNYGEASMIEKDAAMKVFEKLNPNNAKNDKEFEKMLSG